MKKVVESNGKCLWRCHSAILCQCLYGRGSHQLLATRERVLNHKGIDLRNLRGSSNNSTHIPTIWWENGENRTLVEILGGQINRKALHTITFTLEVRTLAYIMIFNLYPMRNLTNLSAPRSLVLFDLFTHKEIDICNHIYHLFTKCITKRNSRLTLPFPSLVMSLFIRARVKIPSGLQVLQREDPISAQTMTWTKAHIPGPSVGVSQIPRDEEGGDTEHFTSVPEDIAQPSSQARAWAPDRLDHLIVRVEQLHGVEV